MHWKREKVTVDRLRVGDLVDLAEDGCFGALTAPELDALRRVWPDHQVIRATWVNDGTSPASPRPRASISRPRSPASVINRLQEALEGTRDRESHLAERVAASVADGHRSPHAFLRS